MAIEPYTLFQSIWIVGGIWVLSKLSKMCYYEFAFEGGGELYLRGELNVIQKQTAKQRIYERILQKKSRKT